MKRFALVLAIVLAVIIPAAAWAGEYFNQVERKEIRRTVAKVLPGMGVDFNDTKVGGVGIFIGPLRDGNFLFIPVNADGEMFIYKAPAEYEKAAWEILKTVFRIIDNRPAADPRALGRNLLERQELE